MPLLGQSTISHLSLHAAKIKFSAISSMRAMGTQTRCCVAVELEKCLSGVTVLLEHSAFTLLLESLHAYGETCICPLNSSHVCM